MTTDTTLVLITVDPSHPIATHAYRYVDELLKAKSTISDVADTASDISVFDLPVFDLPVSVFFYADAAHTANQLRWQTADKDNLTAQWQQLHQNYNLALPVCVSTALARGITDDDNAKRHQLSSANLATGFELVGLGELAQAMSTSNKVIQF